MKTVVIEGKDLLFTLLAVILVSAYGICSAYRGLKKTVAKTIRRWLFEGDSAA